MVDRVDNGPGKAAAEWRSGEPFSPAILDDALGVTAEPISQKMFGNGFQWEIQPTPDDRIIFTLFPTTRNTGAALVTVDITDASGEGNFRRYTPSHIQVIPEETNGSVTLFSSNKTSTSSFLLSSGGFMVDSIMFKPQEETISDQESQ